MTTDEKIKVLASYGCDNWSSDTIFEIALNGFEGYNNMRKAEINQIYNDVFPESGGKMNENPITLNYDICMAAGRDAGDRNMRKHGRMYWNEEDYIIALNTAIELLQTIEEEKPNGTLQDNR